MKRVLLFAIVAIMMISCDNSVTDEGVEGGKCLSGDVCNSGLVCIDDICRAVDGSCGNNIIDPGEECDGSDINGAVCGEYGYTRGILTCNDSCQYDFSLCEGGCGNGVIDPGEECDGDNLNGLTCDSIGHRGGDLRCSSNCTINEASCMPQLSRIKTNADLLFVIDNSLSMIEEQTELIAKFQTLLQAMKQNLGYLPNLHVGVTTTDMGSGAINLPSCENSNNGNLVKGQGNSCNNPMNQMYIVDVEPQGCDINRDSETGICDSTCGQINCDATAFIDENGNLTEPSGLMFVKDEKGCPRCVNYSNQNINEVFSCMANVGVNGCGFEQPFEAMKQAVTVPNSTNDGFVRDTAYLAVVLVSDEDDCSVQNSAFFDPDLHENLSSFNCTRQGLECAEAWSTLDATTAAHADFSSCVSSDATNGDLYNTERYINALTQYKGNAAMVSVLAIAGPYSGNLSISKDSMDRWSLNPSCSSSNNGDAAPAVRIRQLVSYFNDAQDMDSAFYSVCAPSYDDVLVYLGQKITHVMGF